MIDNLRKIKVLSGLGTVTISVSKEDETKLVSSLDISENIFERNQNNIEQLLFRHDEITDGFFVPLLCMYQIFKSVSIDSSKEYMLFQGKYKDIEKLDNYVSDALPDATLSILAAPDINFAVPATYVAISEIDENTRISFQLLNSDFENKHHKKTFIFVSGLEIISFLEMHQISSMIDRLYKD